MGVQLKQQKPGWMKPLSMRITWVNHQSLHRFAKKNLAYMGTSLTNTSRYLVKMSPKIRKVPSYGTLKKNDKGTRSMMVSRHDMKLSSLGIWADGHGYPGWCRCHAASIPSLTCPPWFRWKGSWKDGFLSPPDKFSWFHLQILVDTGWQRYKMYIFICILYVYNMSTAYIYIYVCLSCGFPTSFVAVLRNKVSRPVRIFPAISKVYWWFLKLKAIHQEMMDDRFSFYILMNRIDGL